ncbi:MAG TPA: hypothetical protein VJU15_05300 [Gemmatimonadales bacterium]|nr:hypothetical protein [Gemmatimonadales bacterium]
MHRATLPILLCLIATRPAGAQVSVAGTRNLAFGFLPLGVAKSVQPTDPVQSGQWNLTAPVGQRIQIRLTVPNQLLGPSGASLPLSISNGDAFIQGTWTGAVAESFNPESTVNFRFTGGPGAIIRLGGSTTPAANQQPGPYTNTVVCTLTIF